MAWPREAHRCILRLAGPCHCVRLTSNVRRQKPHRQRMRPSLVQLLLPLPLALLVACSPDAERFKKLVERHEQTTGYVRHLDCGSRGKTRRAYYRFEVNGGEHAGQDDSGQIDCRTSKVGDAVVVYYNPDDPRTHTLLRPSEKYYRESNFPLPGAVFLGALVSFLILAFWKEARKPSRIPQRRLTRSEPRNDA